MRLQTFTGRLVHPMRLTVDDVDIRDIAHALSMLCRFGGHAQQFYSVAQHSFLASQLVPPDEALWALLHDASEAYLVDVPTPLKRLAAMSGYRAVEAQVQLTICHAFGLPHEMPASVHAVDGALVLTEAAHLLATGAGPDFDDIRRRVPPAAVKIVPVAPDVAERAFLKRYEQLTAVAA
jgi:hypothetical protein